MEVPFALALERGKALKLADLNSGFTQSRHDCARLLRGVAPRRSHRAAPTASEKLQALVRSYGEGARGERGGRKDDRACRCDDLQASFDKALDARFGRMRAALRDVPGAAGASDGQRGGRRRRRTSISSCFARRRCASGQLRGAARATGRRWRPPATGAAFEPLEKAAALVPSRPAKTARTR